MHVIIKAMLLRVVIPTMGSSGVALSTRRVLGGSQGPLPIMTGNLPSTLSLTLSIALALRLGLPPGSGVRPRFSWAVRDLSTLIAASRGQHVVRVWGLMLLRWRWTWSVLRSQQCACTQKPSSPSSILLTFCQGQTC